jgi:acyl dehydratase
MPRPGTLEPGQTLTPYVVESVNPEPMKTMAAILDDPNPIHFDVASVRALGLGERPINQGPSNLGYLMEMLVELAGSTERVRRVRVRFLGNVFAGERVECSGSVVSVDAGEGLAELEVEARADGRPVLAGTAVIALP